MIYNFSSNSSKSWPRDTGIYCITNRVNGKKYVGSSHQTHEVEALKLGMAGRIAKHRRELRRGKHANLILQRSFNKHGESNFYFEILELCPKEGILEKEKSWINKMNAFHYQHGYNISDPTNPLGHKDTPPISTPFENKNIQGRSYEFIDPSGNIVSGNNLRQFAATLGKGSAGFCALLNGKAKTHRGYRSTNPDFHRKIPEYRVISPKDELIIFDNQVKFAEQIGVTLSALSGLLTGRIKRLKGFRLEGSGLHAHKLPIYLLSSNGENVHYFLSRKAFSDKYGISLGRLSEIIVHGKTKKGFRLATDKEKENLPVIQEDF